MAVQIYEIVKDMDFEDYSENYNADIAFIQDMIDTFGAEETLSILTQ